MKSWYRYRENWELISRQRLTELNKISNMIFICVGFMCFQLTVSITVDCHCLLYSFIKAKCRTNTCVCQEKWFTENILLRLFFSFNKLFFIIIFFIFLLLTKSHLRTKIGSWPVSCETLLKTRTDTLADNTRYFEAQLVCAPDLFFIRTVRDAIFECRSRSGEFCITKLEIGIQLTEIQD